MVIRYAYYLLFAVAKMEIYENSLNVNSILNRWYQNYKDKNYGAFVNFAGIVRDENGISGLSFEIYEPLLESWFKGWQKRAKKLNAIVLMAHSKGDVLVHESSYLAAVLSPKRKVALSLINDFVEDFKANAPIWKYDIINGQKIYAKDRSQPVEFAGLFK